MHKITVSVDGMRCPMCEAHACDAIRKAFPKVKKVTASHKDAKAVILSDTPLSDDAIREALAPTGYKVGSITTEAEEKKKGIFGIFG